MVKGDNLADNKHFNTSGSRQSLFLRELQSGVEGRKIYRKRIRSKEVSQSWFGVWGLADWIYHVSGQAEHLQGHKYYLSFGLLTWYPGQEWCYLGPRNLFPHLNP